MNPSNSAACHHSPLVDDPLESKVGWLSPADPFYLLLTIPHLLMTPSKVTPGWHPPPPDDPFEGHPWLAPSTS